MHRAAWRNIRTRILLHPARPGAAVRGSFLWYQFCSFYVLAEFVQSLVNDSPGFAEVHEDVFAGRSDATGAGGFVVIDRVPKHISSGQNNPKYWDIYKRTGGRRSPCSVFFMNIKNNHRAFFRRSFIPAITVSISFSSHCLRSFV